MVDILSIVAQYGGFPGIALLAVSWFCYKLWLSTKDEHKAMIELQNTRVAEARESMTEIMKYSESSNKVIGELTNMIKSQEMTVASLRDEIRSIRGGLILGGD